MLDALPSVPGATSKARCGAHICAHSAFLVRWEAETGDLPQSTQIRCLEYTEEKSPQQDKRQRMTPLPSTPILQHRNPHVSTHTDTDTHGHGHMDTDIRGHRHCPPHPFSVIEILILTHTHMNTGTHTDTDTCARTHK